jgi:hypothetical protein
MFRYTRHTRQWVQLTPASSDDVSYGLRRQQSPGTHPGGRLWACSSIDSQSGNLFMGFGQNGASVFYGDVMSYSTGSNLWTYWTGHPTTGSITYPPLGVAQPALNSDGPGGRSSAVCWMANFTLFMFAGQTPNADLTNDLWQFRVANDSWTWVHGHGGDMSASAAAASSGTSGVANQTNMPLPRMQHAGVSDAQGMLWYVIAQCRLSCVLRAHIARCLQHSSAGCFELAVSNMSMH